MQHLIDEIVQVLRHGGTILYPTDTIWGIGCDASNPLAVEKIYALKQRDHAKSMLVLAEEFPMVAEDAFEGHFGACEPSSPRSAMRPTTYIIPVADGRLVAADGRVWNLAANLPAADGTLGVRVPHHAFCQQLLKAFGGPIVSTSANFSGEPSPQSFGEISEALKAAVDFCVPPRPEFLSHETRGSRIVRLLADGTQEIIRR